MEKSSIVSRLQKVNSKKLTDQVKGIFSKVSKNNPFNAGPMMHKQAAVSVPRAGTVRKSTPRSGKKTRMNLAFTFLRRVTSESAIIV